MSEAERTEHLIIETLQTAGDWMDQNQIRKATGLPKSRVENCTLAMSLDDKIERRLVDNDRTQQFRALQP